MKPIPIILAIIYLTLGCSSESSTSPPSKDEDGGVDGDEAGEIGAPGNKDADISGDESNSLTDKDGGVSGEEARDTGGRGESDAGTSGAGTGGAGTGGTISTGGAGGVAGEDVGEAGDSSSVTPDSGGIRICGSRGLPPCPEGEFCDFAEGSDCGADDRGGQCKTKPSICDDIFKPVCGCDGQTYSNACVANSAGISVDHTGDCAIATADNDCDHRKVLCKMMEPICPFGQVPSVSGSCYGPCVPIETCVCSTSEQCPDSSQYTCHISAGHCGPYV